MNRYVLIAFLGCAIFAAQAQQPDAYSAEHVKKVTATIEAINQEDRSLILRGDDNQRLFIVAGPSVRNLEDVQVGDRISARYQQAVAMQILPPGEDARTPKSAAVTERAPEGERTAAGSARVGTTTVTIEAIDTSFDTVTFKRPDGIVRTVAVDNARAKEFIRELSPGDQVQIMYSEAMALDLQAAAN